jgi:cytosine/adenosine deaminase-related metal-dependent hydrolase
VYKKFTAPQIFDGYRFLPQGSVLILKENGILEALLPASEAGDDVQEIDGILCPGFINCHCHLELSHLAGMIPRHTGLPAFLKAVMTTRVPDTDFRQEAMRQADAAMHQEGIVAVGDISNQLVSLPVKLQSALFYFNFIETMGLDEALAGRRFDQAQEILEKFKTANHPRFIGNAIVPHAPYSLSEKLFKLIASYDPNTLLSVHSQESPAETNLFRDGGGDFIDFFHSLNLPISPFAGSGKSSLEIDLRCLPGDRINEKPLILVHNVEAKKEDLATAFNKKDRNGIFWCLCPNANLYIENKLPAIPMLMQSGAEIVLGTDSLASNDQLSLLAEMRSIQEHFPQIALENLLQWATINGAKALQIEQRLGSFEAGKTPGVLRIDPSLQSSARLL